MAKRKLQKYKIELTLSEVIHLQRVVNDAPYWKLWINIRKQLDKIIKESLLMKIKKKN